MILHNRIICAITDQVSMIEKNVATEKLLQSNVRPTLHFTTDWQTCGSSFQYEAENAVGSKGPDNIKS